MEAWEAMKMINHLKEERPKFETERAYWKAMQQKYKPRTKQHLETLMRKEEVFKQRMEDLRLGEGGVRRPQGSGEQLSLKRASKGCRAGGAGHPYIFRAQKELVKAFAYRERSHGHSLTQLDLYLEFRQLVQDEIAVLEERQQQGSLEPGQGARLVACKNKLHWLSQAQNS